MKNKESKKRDSYFDLVRKLKKSLKHKSNSNTHFNLCARNDSQTLYKVTEWLRNPRTIRNHPNFNITEMSQDTEKCPGTWWDLPSLRLQRKTISQRRRKKKLRRVNNNNDNNNNNNYLLGWRMLAATIRVRNDTTRLHT